jgi:hypothetical protein
MKFIVMKFSTYLQKKKNRIRNNMGKSKIYNKTLKQNDRYLYQKVKIINKNIISKGGKKMRD